MVTGIKKGDLVRLKFDRSETLYFVSTVIECKLESTLLKLCDSRGKIFPAGKEMFYKHTAIEVVASASD